MFLKMSTCVGVIFALLFFLQNLALASAPVQITTNASNQGRPDVHGHTIVWKDLRAGNWDIYIYDIYNPVPNGQPVSTNPDYQNLPTTNGFVVVWQDNRGGDNDIWMRDSILGIEQPLVTGPGNQGLVSISGNTMAYVDNHEGTDDIYVIDLTTRDIMPICLSAGKQWQPRISGNRIIWQDDRSGKWDIYFYDMDNPVVDGEPLVAGPGDHAVGDIDGELVVWQDHVGSQYDIMVMNIGDAIPAAVTSDTAFQNSPRVSGDLVVWEDFRNDADPNDTYYDYDIYMKELDLQNLAAGVESPLAAGPSIQARPAVDRETVVWEDTAADNYDVWMTSVPDITPPEIIQMLPSPDSLGVCPSPAISAALSDNRTGVDTGSVILMLDGTDKTADATISETAVSYQSGALPDGPHAVSLTVDDMAGNTAVNNWQFETSSLSPTLPALAITTLQPFWASMEDFTNGLLSVDFTFDNAGTGTDAIGMQILASPASAGVIPAGLPTDPVDIARDNLAHVMLRYLVPTGASHFDTRLYISCDDNCGGQYYFPGAPPT